MRRETMGRTDAGVPDPVAWNPHCCQGQLCPLCTPEGTDRAILPSPGSPGLPEIIARVKGRFACSDAVVKLISRAVMLDRALSITNEVQH